jgi:hypothetical protein
MCVYLKQTEDNDLDVQSSADVRNGAKRVWY